MIFCANLKPLTDARQSINCTFSQPLIAATKYYADLNFLSTPCPLYSVASRVLPGIISPAINCAAEADAAGSTPGSKSETIMFYGKGFSIAFDSCLSFKFCMALMLI